MPSIVMDQIRDVPKVRSVSDYAKLQKYRDEAKRVRETAAAISAPDLREALEEIARQYELLANAIEARLKWR